MEELQDSCNHKPCPDIIRLLIKMDNLSRDVKEVHAYLYGSPTTPGMRVQLDRLEQAEQRRQRHITYLWSTLTAMFISLISLIFSR